MDVLALTLLEQLSHHCSSLRVNLTILTIFSLPYLLICQVLKQICRVLLGEILLMRCE